MNQSTHTPGPWKVELGSYDPHTDRYPPVVTAECRDVCTVEDTYDDGEANARLIAAAPDLLAVCERLRRAIAWSHTEDRMDDAEQLAMIDAAIATAEGR